MPDGLTAFDAEIKTRAERTEMLLAALYAVIERTSNYTEGYKTLRTANDVGFHINRAGRNGAYRNTHEYLDAIDALNDFLAVEIERLDTGR